MTDITRAPAPSRWYFNIPIFGWIARGFSGLEGGIWLALLLVVALIGIAGLTWGLPAIGLIATLAVPLVFVVLIMITLG
ncbi:hypothetical protein GVY41_13205 [Frigidibacter albus]|uniref:Uncharacterized protein n=1 Tax=Frigidibacter albus TaxID=1465486 RepID=A0A6L8VIJ2_9RHOB|nr:hypothetical protein [Frigidibacter albus]MZQ90043.1 hypothetical protein [Frigidibacter albus]NBE31951.1 hypothetical protein [Frigidibacter albus]GGH57669.1 hypothetical protein GCM10011341_27320 [Frigidibacter albus]